MGRRLYLICALAIGLSATTAAAQGLADSVVAQLRDQGFSRISVERTLLGRTQIVALGNGGRREIVLNPRTGEILRDLWIAGGGSGAARGALLSDDSSGSGRGRSGSGGSGDDSGDDSDDDSGDDDSDEDNDSDDDSDDDDDSDNGGSGNSGSGDSGSGGGDDGDDD